jgi:hypothetical protein
MTGPDSEREAIQVENIDGQPVTCDECGCYGLFIIDLFIPGGLRFTCRGCDTRYDKRQLEAIGRRQAKARS